MQSYPNVAVYSLTVIILMSLSFIAISSPLNFKCSVSSCMDTECTVTCTWDPPNDTPLCVTEYFIHNKLDVGCGNLTTVEVNKLKLNRPPIYITECDNGRSHLSTVQGNITTATFEVNKNSNHRFVVVANNHNISESLSSEYQLNTFSKLYHQRAFLSLL